MIESKKISAGRKQRRMHARKRRYGFGWSYLRSIWGLNGICGSAVLAHDVMVLQVASLTKSLLEAAFDGENEELVKLLLKAKDFMKDEVSDTVFLILYRA